jgi:Holliday junction resolvase
VNRNYVNGRATEYRAKKELEKDGYTVIRAAGSHGPWDLIAMQGDTGVRCIQIKKVAKEGAMKRLAFDFEEEGLTAGATWHEEIWILWNRKFHKFARI